MISTYQAYYRYPYRFTAHLVWFFWRDHPSRICKYPFRTITTVRHHHHPRWSWNPMKNLLIFTIWIVIYTTPPSYNVAGVLFRLLAPLSGSRSSFICNSFCDSPPTRITQKQIIQHSVRCCYIGTEASLTGTFPLQSVTWMGPVSDSIFCGFAVSF